MAQVGFELTILAMDNLETAGPPRAEITGTHTNHIRKILIFKGAIPLKLLHGFDFMNDMRKG